MAVEEEEEEIIKVNAMDTREKGNAGPAREWVMVRVMHLPLK